MNKSSLQKLTQNHVDTLVSFKKTQEQRTIVTIISIDEFGLGTVGMDL